jgi:hypothetical protein
MDAARLNRLRSGGSACPVPVDAFVAALDRYLPLEASAVVMSLDARDPQEWKDMFGPLAESIGGDQRRTPCNQTAVADMQRQQTMRSNALSQQRRRSRDGRTCVHTTGLRSHDPTTTDMPRFADAS